RPGAAVHAWPRSGPRGSSDAPMRGRIAVGAGLVVLVLFAAFPFYWAVVASFTPEATLFREPSLWPRDLILDHYRALFTERDFWTPIKNSLIVAGTTTIFCVTIGAFAAYALARIEFPWKRTILGFILAVTMFPQISIVSPLYMLLRALRLINTYPGLVLPYVTFARSEERRVGKGGVLWVVV